MEEAAAERDSGCGWEENIKAIWERQLWAFVLKGRRTADKGLMVRQSPKLRRDIGGLRSGSAAGQTSTFLFTSKRESLSPPWPPSFSKMAKVCWFIAQNSRRAVDVNGFPTGVGPRSKHRSIPTGNNDNKIVNLDWNMHSHFVKCKCFTY